MAKTLIIKGASFATNKIETVSFGGEIPCTGIILDSDTFAFSEDGEEKTIGYTLVPENTTDEVSIVSSNTNVVTVANNKATEVGVGTATITVSCGEISETISVTSTIVMDRYFKSGYYVQRYVSSGGVPQDYTSQGAANNFGYCGAEHSWGSGRYINKTNEPYIPVYKIPKNCASVDIKLPTSQWKTIIIFFDSTQASSAGATLAKVIDGETVAGAVAGERTVNVPDGADSLAIAYRSVATTFSESDLTGYNVTFLATSAS